MSTETQEITNTTSLFEQLPENITYTILTQMHYPYPWKNITHACKLKEVCHSWNNILSDTDKVAQILQIPAMHLLMLKGHENIIDKIIKLKLKGHSIIEPDYCGFTPFQYLMVCNKEMHDKRSAIKILLIGKGINYFKKEHSEYLIKNKATQEYIEDIYDNIYDQLFIKEDLIEAAQNNNLTDAIYMLLTKPILTYKLIEAKTDITQTNTTSKLIVYALQCALEDALDYHANVKESHTKQRIKNYFTNDLIDDFFESFVKNGANPNAYNKSGATPLMALCLIEKKDYFPVITKLLALPKTNVNLSSKFPLNENVPLHLAALDGRFDVIQALLNDNKSSIKCDVNHINKHGFSPLYYSVQSGHYDCVKELIKHGADASIITKKDNINLLHVAAAKGFAKILDILIPLLKNNINHKDCNGRTPLVYCVAIHPENADLCVRSLTNAGADPNIVTNDGRVALHYTPSLNLLEIAKVLLNKGANVNARTSYETPIDGICFDGYTPLHYAAKNGRYNFIELFLEHGADKTLKTTAGATALDVAQEYRDIERAQDNILSFEEHEAKLAEYEKIIKLLS